jgi:probable rRNA maturation factor
VIVLRKTVAGLSEASLARFVTRAARAAGLRGTVNVLVTTSQEMQLLNRRFRGKDKPTDVLSFPSGAGLPVQLLGDIAISANIAAQNAKLLGHAAKDEVKILVLHGVLHLAGYDHERDHGTMARKEMRLRKRLRLPLALIERNRKAREGIPQRAQRRPSKKRVRGPRT